MKLNISKYRLTVPNIDSIFKKCCKILTNAQFKQESIKKLLLLYKERFIEINNIVHKDLAGELSISLVNYEISDSNKLKLDEYFKDVETLNINLFFKEITSKIKNEISSSETTIQQKLVQTLTSWHNDFKKCWDRNLENLILETISTLHRQKCSLSSGVYNFSNYTISEEDQELLKLGKNMILPLRNSCSIIQRRIIDECLSYAIKFRQYIENNKMPIVATNFTDWFDMAILSSTLGDHRLFYEKLVKQLQSLQVNQIESSEATEASLVQRFSYKNFIWLECDKERGMAFRQYIENNKMPIVATNFTDCFDMA